MAYCALGDYLNCTEKWEMTSPANQRGMERSSGGTMEKVEVSASCVFKI